MSILEVKTKDELEAHLVRFTQELGFQTVTAILVIDHVLGESEFLWVDNAPPAYGEIAGDTARGKLDPVMQHCKRKSLPIVWGQATYVEAGRAYQWEEQARFGYCHGIGLALHMPEGRHFFLGVDRDQALPEDRAEITRMAAALQLYAAYAHEASARVLLPKKHPLETPDLTPRELETLRWTLDGKTAWEVGRILGIAENTVIRHAQQAMHKLDCSSKHHAAVKALRLGLIQ